MKLCDGSSNSACEGLIYSDGKPGATLTLEQQEGRDQLFSFHFTLFKHDKAESGRGATRVMPSGG